jgi:hypothetical protein
LWFMMQGKAVTHVWMIWPPFFCLQMALSLPPWYAKFHAPWPSMGLQQCVIRS